MTALVALIAIFAALVALAVWLDHIGFDPWAQYDTDPRDAVKRAHDWEGERP